MYIIRLEFKNKIIFHGSCNKITIYKKDIIWFRCVFIFMRFGLCSNSIDKYQGDIISFISYIFIYSFDNKSHISFSYIFFYLNSRQQLFPKANRQQLLPTFFLALGNSCCLVGGWWGVNFLCKGPYSQLYIDISCSKMNYNYWNDQMWPWKRLRLLTCNIKGCF